MMLKFVLAIAVCLIAASVSSAQETSPAKGNEINVGDVMAFQQERHLKLWFAGRAGNWPLADYELAKLKDGFDDIDKLLGGETVGKAVGTPIAALEKAIDGKDKDTFTRAFDQLTAGCNSCHRTLDHAFIVIQRPNILPYGNQSFAPPK
jgi:hypothetical protein